MKSSRKPLISDRNGPELELSGFEAGLGHENGDCLASMSKSAYKSREFWKESLHGQGCMVYNIVGILTWRRSKVLGHTGLQIAGCDSVCDWD